MVDEFVLTADDFRTYWPYFNSICDCPFCSTVSTSLHPNLAVAASFGGILEDRDHYTFMFENCGFEIYKDMRVEYSTKQLHEETGHQRSGDCSLCF